MELRQESGRAGRAVRAVPRSPCAASRGSARAAGALGRQLRAGTPGRSLRWEPGAGTSSGNLEREPRAAAPESPAAPGPVVQRPRSPSGRTALAAARRIVPGGCRGCAGPAGKGECRRSCRCCKRTFKTRVRCRVLNCFLLGCGAWRTLGAWRGASGFVPEVVT